MSSNASKNAHVLAVVYARAMRDLGLSEEQFARVASEVATFADFDCTILSRSAFEGLLQAAKLQKETRSLLEILFANKRLAILPKLAENLKSEFFRMTCSRLLSVRAYKPLERVDVLAIESTFADVLQEKIFVEQRVDRTLLGGYVVSFGSKELDFSKKAKLAKIKASILS